MSEGTKKGGSFYGLGVGVRSAMREQIVNVFPPGRLGLRLVLRVKER